MNTNTLSIHDKHYVDVETFINSIYPNLNLNLKNKFLSEYKDTFIGDLYQNIALLHLSEYSETPDIFNPYKSMYVSEINDKIRIEREMMNYTPTSNVSVEPCRKKTCKSTNTIYYQKQTRSADEPMTTFYTCLTCGEKWRN